jgi:hypothetical protein
LLTFHQCLLLHLSSLSCLSFFPPSILSYLWVIVRATARVARTIPVTYPFHIRLGAIRHIGYGTGDPRGRPGTRSWLQYPLQYRQQHIFFSGLQEVAQALGNNDADTTLVLLVTGEVVGLQTGGLYPGLQF